MTQGKIERYHRSLKNVVTRRGRSHGPWGASRRIVTTGGIMKRCRT